MSLLIFAIKRFASAVVVLFLVSVLTFLIFFAIPNGNPALRLAGRTATPEDIAIVTKTYGFDKPIYVQYWRTMKQVFNGSIQSYSQHVGVWSPDQTWLPGDALAGASARRSSGWWSASSSGSSGRCGPARPPTSRITTFSFIGISAPTFVVGALLLYLFAFKIQHLPRRRLRAAHPEPVAVVRPPDPAVVHARDPLHRHLRSGAALQRARNDDDGRGPDRQRQGSVADDGC